MGKLWKEGVKVVETSPRKSVKEMHTLVRLLQFQRLCHIRLIVPLSTDFILLFFYSTHPSPQPYGFCPPRSFEDGGSCD